MLRQSLNKIRSRVLKSRWDLSACFSDSPSISTVPMPSLSPTMTHGVITAWNKKPGDILAPGDILCDVETDKASVGFEVQDDGVLAKILRDANSGDIECGTPIALTVEGEDEYSAFLKLPEGDYGIEESKNDSAQQAESDSDNSSVQKKPSSESGTTESRRLSPAARYMVESQGLDISQISGSGKGGLITKEDVVVGLKTGNVSKGNRTKERSPPPSSKTSTSPAEETNIHNRNEPVSTIASPSASTEGTYTDIKNSNMRKVIAKRLTESKLTVPHLYTETQCEIDELLALRKTLKADFGVNVSVNDVVIKAAAMALRDVPECNGRWDSKKECAEYCDSIDISVAVATPSGLITPIVSGADKLGLSGINGTVLDLATRARDGKLKPEEYQGGTFTISNLGMFGITSFNAVINPPQSCILAVSGGVSRVLPPLSKSSSDKPRIATTMTVQLSSDRRVVDEAISAQFCQVFKYYLNNPKLLLL